MFCIIAMKHFETTYKSVKLAVKGWQLFDYQYVVFFVKI